jgi:hypothetical protein
MMSIWNMFVLGRPFKPNVMFEVSGNPSGVQKGTTNIGQGLKSLLETNTLSSFSCRIDQ